MVNNNNQNRPELNSAARIRTAGLGLSSFAPSKSRKAEGILHDDPYRSSKVFYRVVSLRQAGYDRLQYTILAPHQHDVVDAQWERKVIAEGSAKEMADFLFQLTEKEINAARAVTARKQQKLKKAAAVGAGAAYIALAGASAMYNFLKDTNRLK